jgi:hypothetical protein
MRRRANGGASRRLSAIVRIAAAVRTCITVETGPTASSVFELTPAGAASAFARHEHQPVRCAALVFTERRIKRAQSPHDAVKVGAPIRQHPLALFQPFHDAGPAEPIALTGISVARTVARFLTQHIAERDPRRFLRWGDPQLRMKERETPFETVFAPAPTPRVVLAAISAVILLILAIRRAVLRLRVRRQRPWSRLRDAHLRARDSHGQTYPQRRNPAPGSCAIHDVLSWVLGVFAPKHPSAA